jgi:hypothetical protein
MKFSEQELEQARNADLAEYLQNHGFDLKKEGKSYRVQDYSGGLIVTGNKWYWQSEQMGGKSIDFLTNVLEMPFRGAVQELQGVPVHQPDIVHERQETAVQLPERGNNERRVIGYLCQTRGILYANVKRLLQSGNLYQDARGNAVFVIRDEQGRAVGAESHGTATYSRFKNSTMHTGYGFSVRCGTPTGAMFFESAIDLLSYYQIYSQKLKHHDLISIAGVGNDRTIREYHQKYPDRKICLCCDNDTAGDNLIKKMRSELDCRVYVHRPDNAHDWNDALCRSDAESEHENECENVQKT